MMEKMIAPCGLCCSDCAGYKATQADDSAELARIADEASKKFGEAISAESLRCDGCMAEGNKCGYCAVCQIRSCVLEKGIANCAHCTEFGCDRIDSFLNNAPKAKENLADIRRQLSP